MESFNAKQIDNFLTKEECEEIVYISQKLNPWDDAGSEFWNGKVLNDVTIYNKLSPELGRFLINLRDRVGQEIQKQYSIQENIYSDVQQIVRWTPGMEMSPHSDNMENTEHHHHHMHRSFGTVIYLNDDYVGGNTYYPNYDTAITPKAGRLAIHPSDTDHMHGVSKVLESDRFTIVSFWTFDENKKQNLENYR